MSTARGVLLPQEKDLVLMEIIAILCQIYDRHPRTLAEMSSRIEISCIRTHNSLKPKTTDALSRFSGIWKFAKVICGTCGWALNKCELWVPQGGAWNAINYNEKLRATKTKRQQTKRQRQMCVSCAYFLFACVFVRKYAKWMKSSAASPTKMHSKKTVKCLILAWRSVSLWNVLHSLTKRWNLLIDTLITLMNNTTKLFKF